MVIAKRYLDIISDLKEMKTTHNKTGDTLEFYPVREDGTFLIRKYFKYRNSCIFMLTFDINGLYKRGCFTADERMFDLNKFEENDFGEEDLETLIS